jgi:hypothetical protein
MWVQMLPAFLSVSAVPSFAAEFANYRKEATNGLYHPCSYLSAGAIVSIPFAIVLGGIVNVIAFMILRLNTQHVLRSIALSASYICWSDAMAQLCGTLFRTPSFGTMVFILQTIVNMLFNGTLVTNIENVTWAFRWLYQVVPSRYCFRSGVFLEFSGLRFAGYEECAGHPLEMRFLNPCWGDTGTRVLEVLEATMFPVLTIEDTFVHDICLILTEVVAFKLVHYMILVRLAR